MKLSNVFAFLLGVGLAAWAFVTYVLPVLKRLEAKSGRQTDDQRQQAQSLRLLEGRLATLESRPVTSAD